MEVYASIRPNAPFNSSQYLIYNYNCRNGLTGVRATPKRFLLDELSHRNTKDVCQDDNLNFSNNSSYSTTAGETSSDESIFESRLNRPGLTMDGMVEEDMFDIDLGEEESSCSSLESC